MSSSTEEKLIEALSQVFLEGHDNNEPPQVVDGVDQDLVAYISGLLAAKLDEDDFTVSSSSSRREEFMTETLDEVLNPFLESVSCPDHLVQQARVAVQMVWHGSTQSTAAATAATTTTTTTRKLTQGMVSMSSDLDNVTDHEDDTNRYLWGTSTGIKPMANDIIDAHASKSSAKDKRKARKLNAEKERKLLSSRHDVDIDQDDNEYNNNNNNSGGGGFLVRMNIRAMTGNASLDKSRDVQVRNVTVSLHNGTILLESGELRFAYRRRYGLIGENGVGKSTLLKSIAQENGIEGFPQHLRVLHVRQEVPSHLPHDMTVVRAVLESDVERNLLLQQEQEILAKLEQAGSSSSTEEGDSTTNEKALSLLTVEEKRKKVAAAAAAGQAGMTELTADLKELDDIYARLLVLSSDSAESRAAMILSGLQFTPAMQMAPLSSLSGGWKMRVALAASLFIAPDLLMLDEPTNHLDLEAVLWLESYLVDYKHTLVVVSHDRGFLNSVCTDIMEFKKKKLTYYRGNFDNYVKQRDENAKNAMRSYQAYQTKREHMMEFIERFRANAKRSTMVQSRVKTVEKMDAEAPEPVEVDPIWRFSIPNAAPVSPPIIAVNDVSFDYRPVLDDGTKKSTNEYLLQSVNFGVDLSSRIAVLGANGQGKTTLLNLIMGKLHPIKGSVTINGSLRIGHFTQHSSDNFNLKLSALENMLEFFADADDQEMRSFLGKFQIQGNDALKPMMLLSGGQKSRVAFATLAYKKPHVLVIDEGSNHLSMDAVDALVDAINSFQGGVMVVSHDQYFVSKTCSELWVIDGGKATRFRGDFDEYKDHTAEITQKRVEDSIKRMAAMGN